MHDIIITERPDFVNWEDIRQTLAKAHKQNKEHGLIVRSTTLTADQLREQVADGKCYVALDGKKVIGVAAVRIKSCDKWFCHGLVAHFLLDSVLTEYQGYGVYSKMQRKRYEYVEEQGINIITTNTAANNKRMVKMLPKHGFRRAVMFRTSGSNHYSITWVRWFKDEPFIIKRLFYYYHSVFNTVLRRLLHH